jgi:hypothetical protein
MGQRKQQLLKQELSISQILRVYGKRYARIKERYSDGHNGRCALGVIMSFHGWDGKDEPGSAKKMLAAFDELKHSGINNDLLMKLNDSSMTFEDIADYLDRHYEMPN